MDIEDNGFSIVRCGKKTDLTEGRLFGFVIKSRLFSIDQVPANYRGTVHFRGSTSGMEGLWVGELTN